MDSLGGTVYSRRVLREMLHWPGNIFHHPLGTLHISQHQTFAGRATDAGSGEEREELPTHSPVQEKLIASLLSLGRIRDHSPIQ